MANQAESPPALRRLGRSRPYDAASLPERLTRWHRPRADRWERIRVGSGTLLIEHLSAAAVTRETMHSGGTRWIGPGMRWRVADVGPGTRFELEVHAAASAGSSAAPRLRADALDEAGHVDVEDAHALARLLRGLAAGERRLVRGCFDWAKPLGDIPATEACFVSWHPLEVGDGGFTAFVARTGDPVGLADYLARDHLVLEAALAGMLRGNADHAAWLHAALERHIRIEESLVFPAYVECGGREAWVRGLHAEHTYIRQYLGLIPDPGAMRKFARLLDSHDEKEEGIVYPDIIVHLGGRADSLARAAMLLSPPCRAS